MSKYEVISAENYDPYFDYKDWEVDQIKDAAGWTCTLYYKNRSMHTTGPTPKLVSARSQMEGHIDLLIDGEQKTKPLTSFDVKWNIPDDLTANKIHTGFNGPLSGSFGYGGGGYTAYTHCDHDPNSKTSVAYTIGSIPIIGATKSLIREQEPGEKRLIINCSGFSVMPWSSEPVNEVVSKAPFKAIPTSMLKFGAKDYTYIMPPPALATLPDLGDELLLDWDDGKVAPVSPEFWADLYKFITSKGFPYNRIICCCFGGHGRTGTALAALALAGGIFDSSDVIFPKGEEREPTKSDRAIAWVRKDYCSSAIENSRQEDYVVFVDQVLNGKVKVDGKGKGKSKKG